MHTRGNDAHTYVSDHFKKKIRRTHAHLSNGANGLISYGDMIIIHTHTTGIHTHTARTRTRPRTRRTKNGGHADEYLCSAMWRCLYAACQSLLVIFSPTFAYFIDVNKVNAYTEAMSYIVFLFCEVGCELKQTMTYCVSSYTMLYQQKSLLQLVSA